MKTETWAMLATPFTADGRSIDVRSLGRYVQEVMARGCSGAIPLGVIGEPASLSAAERCQVVASVLSAGAPTNVGLMARDAGARLADARTFAATFGSAIAGYLVPVMTSDASALRVELEMLYAVCGRPLVLQDYAGWSSVRIGVDDLASVVEALPWVEAIKCETPPTFGRIHELHQRLPGVRLMSGIGGLGLVDDLSQGATLVASGISRPEVIVEAAAAWDRGDEQECRRLVSSIASTIGFEIQQGTSIAIRKEHWRRQGIIDSASVRAPSMSYEPYMSALSAAHGFTNKEDQS